MTIRNVYLRNCDDILSFDPCCSSKFECINDLCELHTFIDVQNAVTSVGIGPWLTTSNGNTSHCLLAISYEISQGNDLSNGSNIQDEKNDFKGGITLYSLRHESSSYYSPIYDTKFSAKPLQIIWNKCQAQTHTTQSTHDFEFQSLSCCNMITCLFDNGNLEVFEAIKHYGKLLQLFYFTPEMIITSITASQICTADHIHHFYIAAATDTNELVVIKLYGKSIDSQNSLDHTVQQYTTSKNVEGLYSSKIVYKTITSNIDYLSTSHVQKMAITTNSEILAMGSTMGTVTIWDIRLGKSGELVSYTVSNRPIYQLLWTHNSKYIIGYSSSLFVIDWLGSHSISHYDITPYQYQPLCHGLTINPNNKCLMVIRNELIIFPLEQLLSHNPFRFMGFEWMFNGDERSGSFPIPSTCSPKIINNDTTNSGCDNFGAKDVLDHLNWEISLGYTKLVATGLTIIRGVKNYRSGKNIKRQKGCESEFLTFNTTALNLLNHCDFVLSPTCLDTSGENPQLVVYGGSSGLVHLILFTQPA